jgi:hypothetical protein
MVEVTRGFSGVLRRHTPGDQQEKPGDDNDTGRRARESSPRMHLWPYRLVSVG